LDVTRKTKPWRFVGNEVKAAIDIFLQNVPKEKLGPKWKESGKHILTSDTRQ
jgi:hypothetical protein